MNEGEPDRLAAMLAKLASDPPAPKYSEEELLPRARQLIVKGQSGSTSYLQRKLQIGYNLAARLVDRLEAEGVVSPPDAVGRRRVLVTADSEIDGAATAAVEDGQAEASMADLAAMLVERFGEDGARRVVTAARAGTIDGDTLTAMTMAVPREEHALEEVRAALKGASDTVRADHLRQIVEKIEGLFAERNALSETIRDVFAFAKAVGFTPSAIRACVKAREQDPASRKEQEAILEVYRHALGIEGPDFVIPLPTPSLAPPSRLLRTTRRQDVRRAAVALAELSRRARES